jgi:hypothetical protein
VHHTHPHQRDINILYPQILICGLISAGLHGVRNNVQTVGIGPPKLRTRFSLFVITRSMPVVCRDIESGRSNSWSGVNLLLPRAALLDQNSFTGHSVDVFNVSPRNDK